MGLLNLGHRKKMHALYQLLSGPDAQYSDHDELPPDNEILSFARQKIDSFIMQAQDSTRIIADTAKPATYYQRLDFLHARLDWLQRVEAVEPRFFARPRPSAIRRQLDKGLPTLEAEMWTRAFDKAIRDAYQKKTDAARLRIFTKLFDQADLYAHRIDAPARAVIERQRAQLPAAFGLGSAAQ